MRELLRLRCGAPWAAAVLMLLVFSHGEASAQLNKDDQKCVNEINKNFEKVGKAQGGDISKCTKDAGKGKLTGTYSECITSDPKGKVAKAIGKLTSKVGSKCPGNPAFPILDVSKTDEMNAAAIAKELGEIVLLLGSDLDGAIVDCDDNKDACGCQAAIVKQMYKCQGAKLKSFNACKKDELKGKNGPAVTSAQELQDACLGTGIEGIPDTKGKIQKDCDTKLASTITKKCPNPDQFPGCGTVDAAGLKACVDELVECQVCLSLNALDGLARDCDLFDDGLANGTCPLCGNGVVEFPEMCDDGNQVNGDGCTDGCFSENAFGAQVCALDESGTCIGDPNHPLADPNDPVLGQSCTDTTNHTDCDSLSGVLCVQNTNFLITTVALTLLLPVGGDLEIDCGGVDPNTGKAVCDCSLDNIVPISIPAIGFVCINTQSGCASGEVDCDGGNALDLDVIGDHDIGPDVEDGDPNGFPVPFCGIANPDGNAECAAMCEIYCANEPGNYEFFDSACEGFCDGGSSDGDACNEDLECPGGGCNGPDPVSSGHPGLCQCTCLEIAGSPAPRGGLTCEIGVAVVVESQTPCDGTDVSLEIPSQCVPLTTQQSTATLRDAEAQTGQTIVSPVRTGSPIECADLAAGNMGDFLMAGNLSFYDSDVGDLVAPMRWDCTD